MDKFEEFGRKIDGEVSRLKKINNFEDFGKRVDEELARVKSFVKEEVAPETEKRTAQFLREVSEKLSEAAGWIDGWKADTSLCEQLNAWIKEAVRSSRLAEQRKGCCRADRAFPHDRGSNGKNP